MKNNAFPSFNIGLKYYNFKLLFLCYYDPKGISTVPETVAYIQDLSKFPIEVINLYGYRYNDLTLTLKPSVQLNDYDGLIIHNSISYEVDVLKKIDVFLNPTIKNYSGLKIMFKQDENHKFRQTCEYLEDRKFDIIYTCLEQKDISKIYPSKILREKATFHKMLTGYVTPRIRNINFKDLPRTIDIGYRGSIQPIDFGMLCYEKRKIGEDVEKLIKKFNENYTYANSSIQKGRSEFKKIKTDISVKWEDRFGGESWFKFLSSCKSTLGVESGASIFDVFGDLNERLINAEKKYGPKNESNRYSELVLSDINDLENIISYAQVSPRHFEAAATKTLQILFPGKYSNIFIKDKHYIELKRDYSNLYEIIEKIKDDDFCKDITNRAYEDIIQNKTYSIENFVENFDESLLNGFKNKNIYQSEKSIYGIEKTNVAMLIGHKPDIDPRLDWVSKYAGENIRIIQFGCLQGENAPEEVFLKDGRCIFQKQRYLNNFINQNQWTEEKQEFDVLIDKWFGYAIDSKSEIAINAMYKICWLSRLSKYNDEDLNNAVKGNGEVRYIRWYIDYFIETAITLLENVSRFKTFNSIISVDLDTLLPGIVLKGIYNIPLIYDAHEFWPESNWMNQEFETAFLKSLEFQLLKEVDYCQTVTKELAKDLYEIYDKEFGFVPNCSPKSDSYKINKFTNKLSQDGNLYFLFQGGIAPGRNLENLCRIWNQTNNKKAILLIRGPESELKKELREIIKTTYLNTNDNRIMLLDPVKENELIEKAKEADIGLITYSVESKNYLNASPNKLCQYFAAKIPVVSTKLNHVESIIMEANAGKCIDINNLDSLNNMIDFYFNNREEIKKQGENGYKAYIDYYNWENVSKSLYKKIEELTKLKKNNLKMYPTEKEIKKKRDDKFHLNSYYDLNLNTYEKEISNNIDDNKNLIKEKSINNKISTKIDNNKNLIKEKFLNTKIKISTKIDNNKNLIKEKFLNTKISILKKLNFSNRVVTAVKKTPISKKLWYSIPYNVRVKISSIFFN